MITKAIIILALFAIMLIMTLLSALIFYKKIYAPYKRMASMLSPSDIFGLSNAIIKSTLDLYQKNVFDNGGIIDNAQFENYYKSITHEIIDSFSEEYLTRVSYIMNVDVFIQSICRTVREYLSEVAIGDQNVNEDQ